MKILKKFRRKNRLKKISKPAEGPLSARALNELSLFSTSRFIFAALLIQFILTSYTAFLLKIFSISFQYRPFMIIFMSQGSLNWTENQIYLVFGSGPLILTAFGLILFYLMRRLRKLNWKTKLFFTWMAFIMVNTLPFSIIAGVLFFDSFGIAFHWFVTSYILRGIIALATLLGLIFSSRLWQRQFLKTAYSSTFLDNEDYQKWFLVHVYFKPWIYGLIVLLVFNIPFISGYWPLFLLSAGYLAIPLLDFSMRNNILIRKSDKKIFTSRSQVVLIIIVIGLIWIAGNISINF